MSEKSRRVQKVEKELRQIVSSYLVKQQSGSSSNLVTVTNISVSPDLRNAKVYVAVVGQETMPEGVLEDTQSHAYRIQQEISKSLRMKFCPKIVFYADESIAMFAKMDALRQEAARNELISENEFEDESE